MEELRELQRQGMSMQAISELTGWDRKTIRYYLSFFYRLLHDRFVEGFEMACTFRGAGHRN